MIKQIFLFFFLLSPLFFYPQEGGDTIAIRYADMISVDNLKKNLTVLASDEFEGRETGRKGQKLAAEYIVQKWQEAKVKAGGDDGYYQHYLLEEKLPGLVQLNIGLRKLKNIEDYYYYPRDINITETRNHELVFLGYGIEAKDYNDYKGADVSGKVVMIISGEPQNSDSISLVTEKKNSIYWNDRIKIHKAKEKGVALLLIVKDDLAKDIANNKTRIESPSMKLINGQEKEMTTLYISKTTANKILQKQLTIDEAKQQILKTKQSSFKTIKTKQIKLMSKTQRQQISAENVLGFIEGKEKKEEVIVISAHYDHLGIIKNEVYNGADDDGTGTVTLLELAKVFAIAKEQGDGPKRSILFIAFSGEEKGLLGSSYYVKHPIIPLANTVCDLNIDMIGRIDEQHQENQNYVYLIGSDKLSTEFHNISEAVNKKRGHLSLDYTYNDEKDPNRFYYRSDHYNFAKNNVPVIFYFSGVHEDYHQPTDDIEKIRFDKVEKIARLVFFTAWEVANRNERIKVDITPKGN